MPRTNAPVVAGLAVLTLARFALAQGSDPEREPAATVARYEEYLEASPYAISAFEGLIAAAAASEGVEGLRARYEARVERASDISGRVVLARLLARANEQGGALTLLDALPAGDPRRDLLRASCLEELGREREALGALDLARAWAREGVPVPDRELRLDLERRAAELHLWLGERDQAARAFAELANVHPDDVRLRLEVADQCAGAELYEESLRQYQTALLLAGEDVEARVRVLAARGGLYERISRTQDALDAYRSVRTALGRGHWLKREVLEKSLALARRAGALDALVVELEGESERDPLDVETALALASALELAGKADRARSLLAELGRRLPSDVELGRRLAASLERAGDLDGAIRELERLGRLRPDDRELVFEQAELDLAAGREANALARWQRALDRAPEDMELLRRVANRQAQLGRIDEASGLLERVIARESGDLRGYADLARLLGAAGRSEEALDVLVRAEPSAETSIGGLFTLASLAGEIGSKDRAQTLLVRATERDPEGAAAWLARGELERELGQPADGMVSLWQAVRAAATPAQREQAIALLLTDRDDASLLELAAKLEESSRTGAVDVAELWVAARALERAHEYDRAAAVAERIAGRDPKDVEARVLLARLDERRGDLPGMIVRYEELLRLAPENSREWLGRIFQVHVQLEQRPAAVDVAERMAPLVAENAGDLLRLARGLDALNAKTEALVLARRALRAGASKPDVCTELAEIFERCSQPLDARRALLVAWRSSRSRASEKPLAERALERLYGLLQRAELFESEMRALEERFASDPWDHESARLLAALHYLDFEEERALAVLDRQLVRTPDDVELLTWRERTLRDLELEDRRAEDLKRLIALSEDRDDELVTSLVSALLAAGRPAEALVAASMASDLLPIAKVLYDAGEYAAAADLLEPLAAPDDAPRTTLELRARALAASGQIECAVEVYQRRFALASASVPVRLEYADRLLDLGLEETALAFVDGMLGTGRADPKVYEWYDRHGSFDHLADTLLLRCLRAGEQPDPFTFGSIARLGNDQFRRFLALGERIRAMRVRVESGEVDGFARSREELLRDLSRFEWWMWNQNWFATRVHLDAAVEGIRQGRLPDVLDTAMMLWQESRGFWPPADSLDLEEIASLYPESAMVLAARAMREYERGAEHFAGELFLDLAEILSAEPTSLAERAEHARFLKKQVSACTSIAQACSGRPGPELLIRTLVEPGELEDESHPCVPFRNWALERAVAAFGGCGAPNKALEILARLPEPDENALMQWVRRVELLEEASLDSELAAAREHLAALFEDAWAGGGMFDRQSIAKVPPEDHLWLATRLERAGDWVDLYELYRCTSSEQARALLQKPTASIAVERHFERRISAAERELGDLSIEQTEARAAAARKLYDAGIEGLEVRVFRRDLFEARALCERLLGRLGEHPILLARAARIAELDGATEEAIALHERSVAARRPGAPASIPARDHEPVRAAALPMPLMSSPKWSLLYAALDEADPLSPGPDLLALVRLECERGNWPAAIDRVRALDREGLLQESWVSLLASVMLQTPSAADRELLGQAWHDLRPDLPRVVLPYAAALLEKDRPEEARVVLAELALRSAELSEEERLRLEALLARADRATEPAGAARDPR